MDGVKSMSAVDVNHRKSSKELYRLIDHIKAEPMFVDMKPFQILDNIFYVGNRFVASYLIDTGEGLLLIDSNFQEVLPILLKNIQLAGYSVSDIKWLLLSHGHFDHVGGAGEIQRLSGCETYFPQGDAFMLKERRDLLLDDVKPFDVDHFYDYSHTYHFGNVTVRPVLTSGHTLGCTSLQLTVPFRGKDVSVAVHGGLGLNGLSREELIRNKLPLDTSLRYRDSLIMAKELPADVFLPLHNSYYDIFSLAEQDNGDHSIFIRPGDWKKALETRLNAIEELLKSEKEAS